MFPPSLLWVSFVNGARALVSRKGNEKEEFCEIHVYEGTLLTATCILSYVVLHTTISYFSIVVYTRVKIKTRDHVCFTIISVHSDTIGRVLDKNTRKLYLGSLWYSPFTSPRQRFPFLMIIWNVFFIKDEKSGKAIYILYVYSFPYFLEHGSLSLVRLLYVLYRG